MSGVNTDFWFMIPLVYIFYRLGMTSIFLPLIFLFCEKTIDNLLRHSILQNLNAWTCCLNANLRKT